ncbi:glycoside hydrolase family 13 protein [Alloiococcus sp. CFN-8]|uniref:glycoside hydrolase family 13 protein n=1 Tax=Alloiococcus sp. CFN-8 TaxID=3416081 RepID=UPI003CE784E8
MKKFWWKEGIGYQIYVRSFKDTSGDGIGDIKGVIQSLDYLQDLGVNILYLNPINESPNDDNGYDISNFRTIMKEYGSLEDFNSLVKEAHERGMYMVMDLVINHTSDEHPWFIESRKNNNKYRDFYVWKKGKNGEPPNNWGSFFGGSAWEYDDTTEEYYLHIFSKKMPDLNWDNNEVRKEMHQVIKYWTDLGVDGFRLDAINHIAKDTSYPDGPVGKDKIYGDFLKYVQNIPRVHDYIRELREEVLPGDDIVLIGETGGINYKTADIYTGIDRNELHMVFHFDFHSVGKGEKPWERKPIDLVKDIKEKMSGWQNRQVEEGWQPLFYSNHDTTRTLSRLGDEERYPEESAKMLALLQFTQRGTPFIYYGDEIGMTNPKEFSLEDYRDVSVFNNYREQVEEGRVSHEDYLKGLYYISRDNSRTPMQWDDTEGAGFTDGIPWMKVNDNYKEVNVREQQERSSSILSFYKRLTALRKGTPALIYGDFKDLLKEHKEVYCYLRTHGKETYLIMVNFFSGSPKVNIPEKALIKDMKVVMSNYDSEVSIDEGCLQLRPYEAAVYKLDNGAIN